MCERTPAGGLGPQTGMPRSARARNMQTPVHSLSLHEKPMPQCDSAIGGLNNSSLLTEYVKCYRGSSTATSCLCSAPWSVILQVHDKCGWRIRGEDREGIVW